MKNLYLIILFIVPFICSSQNKKINSNFYYTQYEDQSNTWIMVSSKFEDNTFDFFDNKIIWNGPKKIKQYTIESHRIFEGNLIYVVRDINKQIMVFKIIKNESLSILWLDNYSRRHALVFDIL